ncbi:hypothetical protein FB472_2752 [Rhodoglobus vestalii]|uniref:Alpha-galactosidase-like protein n=1 Tax=Rhodoglobus vestalii TaxID=193384 RepID=A0A8H2PZW2_9MICO|nr:hypothetical protein [Rhodoglobus vestalii]TQO21083.1 hypothetical protein FB472_2752 [Rhodoglobus vestalii]
MRLLTAFLCLLFFAAVPVPSASAATLSADAEAATGTLIAAPPPGTPDGSIGIRLVDVPVATQNDPRARSYIVDHLNPGVTIDRRVEIENKTSSNQSVRLYAGAARIAQGGFKIEDGAAKNELTTWTSLSPSQLDLSPGQQTTAVVTINVPQDAPETEQYAVIWAEVRGPAPVSGDPAPGGGGGVTEVSRVGIRVYLSTGPGNGPPTAFRIDSITASTDSDGSREVTAQVSNTGGRALDITGALALSNGPGGISAGSFPITRGTTIAPGTSADIAVALDPLLPTGPWKATLDVTSGFVTVTATAELTFPPAGQDQPLNPLWFALGGGLLLLLIAALILWILWRKKSRNDDEAEATASSQ